MAQSLNKSKKQGNKKSGGGKVWMCVCAWVCVVVVGGEGGGIATE